jgi:RimJ/RimL family protein N-acetyltransferase
MHIILETPRLILRQFAEDDVDNLFDLNSDPEVMRYLTGGRPTPRDEIRDQIIPFHLAVYDRLDRLGTWAAESAATGEFLGWFHFRPGREPDTTTIDLGYRLRRPAWDKGYATEGSGALIDRGFTDLGVERVFAHTMAVNAASRRVLEKCGLTLVRTLPYKGPFEIEGAEHGEAEYALTKPEWEARGRRYPRLARSPHSPRGNAPARPRRERNPVAEHVGCPGRLGRGTGLDRPPRRDGQPPGLTAPRPRTHLIEAKAAVAGLLLLNVRIFAGKALHE